MVMFCPSAYPSSRSAATNAFRVTRFGLASWERLGERIPILGILAACCARAVGGHAAAPPISVMNSRRLIAINCCLCSSKYSTLMGASIAPPRTTTYHIVHAHAAVLRVTAASLLIGHVSNRKERFTGTEPDSRVRLGSKPDMRASNVRSSGIGERITCQRQA